MHTLYVLCRENKTSEEGRHTVTLTSVRKLPHNVDTVEYTSADLELHTDALQDTWDKSAMEGHRVRKCYWSTETTV